MPPLWNEPILKVLEGSYPNGFTDEEWNEAQRLILPCYQERGIEWVRSCASQDKTRVVCELNAPDAEVIREARGKAGIPFDRVWCAEVLRHSCGRSRLDALGTLRERFRNGFGTIASLD